MNAAVTVGKPFEVGERHSMAIKIVNDRGTEALSVMLLQETKR